MARFRLKAGMTENGGPDANEVARTLPVVTGFPSHLFALSNASYSFSLPTHCLDQRKCLHRCYG
ncbi:hypothetical protein C8J34_1011261 [Rhizobium sp. PP-F2F-G36]|nr:hypothetical protein C8J34_1011261 [Rhizobium sp. PP-F2F-G36]